MDIIKEKQDSEWQWWLLLTQRGCFRSLEMKSGMLEPSSGFSQFEELGSSKD